MRRIAALLLFSALSSALADDPTGFLLGQRWGAGQATLPVTWDTATNVLWQADIPGAGWSSPIVVADRVLVTTAISAEKPPEARKGLYINDLQGKPLPGEHRWQVLCLDARSGKQLWSRTAFSGKATGSIHIKNSLASETPVSDGKHVWAHFGNVGVACFDLDGKEVWSQRTRPYKTRMGWGTGGSPALFGDRLFLVHDNEEKSFLQALDARTGKQIWRVDRDEGSNWGTPLVWKNRLRTELVTAGTRRVRSYDLDGQVLWELKGMSIISIPSPVAHEDTLYVSSGYVLDPFIKPVYAIRPGARGDISLSGNETSNSHILWAQKQAGAYHPTPVTDGQYLYVLYDRGFLGCYEARTGKEIYGKMRLGGGASAFTASPWVYGGKVFCLSEDGETFVVAAGKEFKVVARNRLDEMTLASPAIAGGSLFVRTQTKLYCLRQRK